MSCHVVAHEPENRLIEPIGIGLTTSKLECQPTRAHLGCRPSCARDETEHQRHPGPTGLRRHRQQQPHPLFHGSSRCVDAAPLCDLGGFHAGIGNRVGAGVVGEDIRV